MPAKLDLTGQKYNKLTALREVDRTASNKSRWLCRCDCGNEIAVNTMHLRSGHTKSCGCIPRQNSDRVDDGKGNMVRPEGYGSWLSIRSRCYCVNDENYKNYGAKGITVCDRWRGPGGLANFLKDMGPKPSPKHSVGRLENDKGYSPENCRWETAMQQGANRSNLRLLTFRGKTQHIAAWARELGLEKGGIHLRLRRGWTVEQALSTPRLGRAPADAGVNPTPAGCVNQAESLGAPRSP